MATRKKSSGALSVAKPTKRKRKIKTDWVERVTPPTPPPSRVLFTSEYEWMELSTSVTKEEFLAEMNRMGKEGWRAFHITDHGGMTRSWFVKLRDD